MMEPINPYLFDFISTNHCKIAIDYSQTEYTAYRNEEQLTEFDFMTTHTKKDDFFKYMIEHTFISKKSILIAAAFRLAIENKGTRIIICATGQRHQAQIIGEMIRLFNCIHPNPLENHRYFYFLQPRILLDNGSQIFICRLPSETPREIGAHYLLIDDYTWFMDTIVKSFKEYLYDILLPLLLIIKGLFIIDYRYDIGKENNDIISLNTLEEYANKYLLPFLKTNCIYMDLKRFVKYDLPPISQLFISDPLEKRRAIDEIFDDKDK